MFSIPHLIIVFVVALVVFGPEKLPELARNVGKLMGEFRKATGDLRSTFEGHLRDLEREADLRRPANSPASNTIASPTASPTPAYSAYTSSPAAAQEEVSTALGATGTVPTTPAHLGIGTPVVPPPVVGDSSIDTPVDPEAVAFFSAVNASDSVASASSAPSEATADSTVHSTVVHSDAAGSAPTHHEPLTLDPPHNPESLTDARTRPA